MLSHHLWTMLYQRVAGLLVRMENSLFFPSSLSSQRKRCWVGTAIRLQAGRTRYRDSILVRGKKFSLHHNVENGCGFQPASHAVTTGASFRDDKVSVPKSWHFRVVPGLQELYPDRLYIFKLWWLITSTLYFSPNVKGLKAQFWFIQNCLCCTQSCCHPTWLVSDEENSPCLSHIAVLLCRYPVADASSTTSCYFAVYY